MAGNPRIDELRKKLEKEPQSRLFAQLAEELRKEGDLEEAIRVAREGLQKHPSYPSARMTLGRALFDTGDRQSARAEFEQVLKGAPDNILASRLLGECLEALGDLPAAIARYKATLALAPGDKQLMARLTALEGGGGSAAPVTPPGLRPSSPPRAPAPPAAPVAARAAVSPPVAAAPEALAPPAEAAEPPPIPLVEADEEFELERSFEPSGATHAPPVPALAPAPSPPAASAVPERPIPLVEAGAEFELEQPYETPAAPPPAPTPLPEARVEPEPSVEPEVEPEIEPAVKVEPETKTEPAPVPQSTTTVEAGPIETDFATDLGASTLPPGRPPSAAAEPRARGGVQAAAPGEEAEFLSTEEFKAVAPGQAATVDLRPGEPASDLASPTLAELYFNQGLTKDAVRVYEQLLEREPGNARFGARLSELRAVAQEAPADPAARRVALERTIARLEGLLAAIRKG